MLRILKDNKPFVLPNDIQIPWLFRSPFFNEYASRTGTFDLSAKSVVNQQLLNHPSRLTKKNESKSNVDVVLENRTFRKSLLLKLQESDDDLINCVLFFDEGRFANLTRNKTLKDIDLGSFVMGESSQDIIDHANSIVDTVYPDINHAFPMMSAPNFYNNGNELNPDFCGYVNYYEPGIGFLANTPEIGSERTLNKYNLVPCLYVFFVLERIFKKFGYSIDAHKFINDPELQSLLFQSNYALDLLESKYYVYVGMLFPQDIGLDGATIKFNNDQINPFEDEDECHSTITFKTEIKELGWHQFELDLPILAVPGVYARVNLYKDNELLETSIFSAGQDEIDVEPYWSDAIVNRKYYFNNDSVGKVLYFKIFFFNITGDTPTTGSIKNGELKIRNLGASSKIRYNPIINYADHVPGLSIKDFISIVETLTCSVFSVNDSDRKVSIHFWKDVLTNVEYSENLGQLVSGSKKVDYPNRINGFKLGYANKPDVDIDSYFRLPDLYDEPIAESNHQINDIVLVVPMNSFFIFRIPEDTPEANPVWGFLCVNAFDHEVNPSGDNVEEKEIDATLPRMVMLEPSKFVVPLLEGGYSPIFSQDKAEQEASFLFYRGMQPNTIDVLYPFASPVNLNSKGDIIGDYSLIPEHLAETLYKSYISWILRRFPVKIKSHLSFSLLQNLSYAKKHRLEGANYLINSIELGMTLNSLTQATIDLYTI